MNRLLVLILLLSISTGIQAGAAFKDLTPEQREAMREFMEVPEPEPEPEVIKSAPAKPTIQGSRSAADKAYRNKDYKTALKHYKALAKEGDGEASLIVGTMHEEGQGTEKDSAAARAWYKKASDTNNDDGAGSLLAKSIENEKGVMTPEDIAKSEKIYEELSKEKSESIKMKSGNKGGLNSGETMLSNQNIEYSKTYNANLNNSIYDSKNNSLNILTKITPKKYLRNANDQLSKTKNMEHFKPEKYTPQN